MDTSPWLLCALAIHKMPVALRALAARARKAVEDDVRLGCYIRVSCCGMTAQEQRRQHHADLKFLPP
jgi:hypothetical protein